jgi:transcriptional regulator with XRE-family HTH domain
MPRPKSRKPESDIAAKLGELLAQLRLEAGYKTQEAFAAALQVSRDVITKAENGTQPPTDPVFLSWAAKCGATAREIQILTGMLVVARAIRGPIPQFIQLYLEREKEAEFVRIWAHVQVPGLLQIKEYADAMYDLPGIDKDWAAETIAVRMERQSLMDGPDAAQVIAVLDEAVLYRCIGKPAIMVKQLDHLLEVSERPNVSIHIAQGIGAYWGLAGAFEIASGPAIPDTLVTLGVEDQTSEDRTIARKALILFEKIRSNALNAADSRAVQLEAREHWNSQQQ